MSVITAQNLSKYYGPDEVFSGISLQIPPDARIAMVGPNGAGKTTLINILVGLDSPTDGTVSHKKGLTIGYLPQRPQLEGERTLWEEMLTAFDDLRQKEAQLHEIEHALADPLQADQHDELLARYGRLQEVFEMNGGYTYEIDIKRVLEGLSFDPEADFDRPLSQLSGGQITRALLARLLLEKPELLVMDEPTNHLDIQAVEWLEGYLKSWEGAVLMVSHDRYFIDNVATAIWELDFGELEVYRGNYSHYALQREERYERLAKEYEAQQAFIEKEQDYIRRNIAGQNTNQAKGRLRRLERLMSGTDRRGRAVDKPWQLRRPRRREKIHVQLDATQAGRTGREVFKTKQLVIGYPDDEVPLFEAPDILLVRQEVAAVIGPNGTGKTTFVKTILEKLEPLAGSHQWGANVKIGYFAQAHENLNDDNTILDELLTIKNLPLSQARNYLATYLFQGDDVFRKVNTLSGGERGRLALAKLSLDGANVLVLDEPTNHLDIEAQEVLQNVLADFSGTILMISHDRYLIDALATQIWAIEPGKMTVFEGPYQEYLEARAGQKDETPSPTTVEAEMTEQPTRKRHNGMTPYARRKRLEELEIEIHQLETEIERLSAELASASAAGKIEDVTKLGQQYSQAEATLHDRMAEWVELA